MSMVMGKQFGRLGVWTVVQGVGPPSKAALNRVAPSKDRNLANSTPAKAAAPQGQVGCVSISVSDFPEY